MSIADVRPALRSFLLNDATVSAAVGGERIFPVVLPQGERGASIVYNRVSAVGDHHMQGASGLAMVRMQIDAWAELQDDADVLARAVKDVLDGYQGPMGDEGSPPGPAVAVQGAFFDNQRDEFQSDIQMYRASADYLIWFEER
jgi:hypothetical protein